MDRDKRVLIFGATGNMGGAAARELLRRGWQVRGVTRNSQSEKALAIADLGAEMVQADMDDPASLAGAFDGMERVFSVQNWLVVGVDAEIRQAKAVADVALSAGVRHLVYGSAGVGESGTGIPHFESKVVAEGYMRDLGLPLTTVRPTPFMELLSKPEFFPQVGAWGTLPRAAGWETLMPWVAVDDIGVAIANTFENPDVWIGRDVNNFAGDVKSMRECRAVFQKVTGKKPFRIPFPVILFERFVSEEMVQMWRWIPEWVAQYGEARLWADVEASRTLHPGIRTLEAWLRQAQNGQRRS